MSAANVFTFRDQGVRTVVIDGEGWFALTDVCAVLGVGNPSQVASRLDDDALITNEVIDSMGRRQSARFVSEPGLYEVTFLSRKPEAKAFKRWVTREVLPAIRRTGQYGSQIPASFAEALELAASEARRVEALEAQAAIDAPKVEAFDALMDADGFYTMEAAGKILGLGRVTFYRRLREAGVIQSGSRLPYQRYMHHFVMTAGSWTDAKGNIHPTQTTRVRPSGMDFLRRRLEQSREVLT